MPEEVSGSLAVLGRTLLTDLGVTGSITNGLLSINGFSCEILNQVQDDTGSCGSTINSKGTLFLQSDLVGGIDILSGKVTIDTQGNLKVAEKITAKRVETEELRVLGDKSSGVASIPAGLTFVDIESTIASTSSKIFITPLSRITTPLSVSEKKDGKFRVEIPQSASTSLPFDWLIIGGADEH